MFVNWNTAREKGNFNRTPSRKKKKEWPLILHLFAEVAKWSGRRLLPVLVAQKILVSVRPVAFSECFSGEGLPECSVAMA